MLKMLDTVEKVTGQGGKSEHEGHCGGHAKHDDIEDRFF